MPYAVEVLPSAQRQLAALPQEAQRRIARKIDLLREIPRPPGAMLLHAEDRLYRLRVSDFRVIYTIEGRRLVVVVIRIGHRKDIYRDL